MIIGLCGYAQTGKDTLAEQVKTQFTRFAFADELKREVSFMLRSVGLSPDFNNAEDKAFWRDMLVFWGRKQRQIDPDYWVKKAINSKQFMDTVKEQNVIVTDVRYFNEVEHIRKAGGRIIRLHREGYTANNEEEAMTIAIIDKAYPNLLSINNNGTKTELGEAFMEVIK